MVGLTVVAVRDFIEDGYPWRTLEFDNGTTVHIMLTAPWLVVENDQEAPLA